MNQNVFLLKTNYLYRSGTECTINIPVFDLNGKYIGYLGPDKLVRSNTETIPCDKNYKTFIISSNFTIIIKGNEILTVVIIEVTFGFYRDSIFILQIIGRLHLMVSVAGTVCPITTIDIPKRMAI